MLIRLNKKGLAENLSLSDFEMLRKFINNNQENLTKKDSLHCTIILKFCVGLCPQCLTELYCAWYRFSWRLDFDALYRKPLEKEQINEYLRTLNKPIIDEINNLFDTKGRGVSSTCPVCGNPDITHYLPKPSYDVRYGTKEIFFPQSWYPQWKQA